ncbi:MAG: N-acetylneuraminate lyase [Cyclobacteriaceae bacterium]|nr:MAG: N-acetylneuraminate lyase [Cyclobacteriaceae bacterium]
MNKINGLIAATYPPLDQSGKLNLAAIGPYAEFLAKNRVNGAFLNGSTGDFTSLSVIERKQIVEEWSRCKPAGFDLMVHVGDTNVDQSIELARHASKLEVDAIASLAPFYYKPAKVGDLVNICKQIAAVTPNIPFYYYHIPQLSGVNFDMVEFLELAAQDIPNLGGIKYSQQDLIQLMRCNNFLNGKYEMLFGVDEILLCALTLGVTCAVGSTYNYLAPLNHRMIEAYKNGTIQEAQALQYQVVQLVSILSKYGFHAASKHVLKYLGIDLGPVRMPMPNLNNREKETLEKELATIRIFELV